MEKTKTMTTKEVVTSFWKEVNKDGSLKRLISTEIAENIMLLR